MALMKFVEWPVVESTPARKPRCSNTFYLFYTPASSIRLGSACNPKSESYGSLAPGLQSTLVAGPLKLTC